MSFEKPGDHEESSFSEAMAVELRNIESCMNYLFQASVINEPGKSTKIATGQGFHAALNSHEESKGGNHLA